MHQRCSELFCQKTLDELSLRLAFGQFNLNLLSRVGAVHR